jgi:hypothetical protein
MYITKIKAISPQKSYQDNMLEQEAIIYCGNKYPAIEPDYMGMIPPNLLRRMGKAIRMGIGAATPVVASSKKPDAIIIGSSEGGLEDCFKFLIQIIDYHEGTLSPTNFVQSTPNALAGNIAISSGNTNYNNTHVHKGHAFENALIDAQLLFSEHKAKTALVGNVDEISNYNYNVELIAGQFKKEETTSETLFGSKTEGTVCGEGSAMFYLQSKADEYLAQIVDIELITHPETNELTQLILEVLERNQLQAADIHSLVLGYSGDCRTDWWYDTVKQLFDTANLLTFKNLCGEYPTSSAFALFYATLFLSDSNTSTPEYVVIYNHYKGEQHSIILLKK